MARKVIDSLDDLQRPASTGSVKGTDAYVRNTRNDKQAAAPTKAAAPAVSLNTPTDLFGGTGVVNAYENNRKNQLNLGPTYKSGSVKAGMPSLDTRTDLTGLSLQDANKALFSRLYMVGNQGEKDDTTSQMNFDALSSMYGQYNEALRTPGSKMYNPYASATNEAISGGAQYGFDFTTMTEQQIDALARKAALTNAGNIATPNSKSTRLEWAAYYATKYLAANADTQAAQEQLANVRQSVQWMVDNGYSDSEIRSAISQMYEAKNWATLKRMDDERALGKSVALNSAVDWGGLDNLNGMIWSVRNGTTFGNSSLDTGAYEWGMGSMQTGMTEAQTRRDSSNLETYHPYADGTTMQDMAMKYGVSQFDETWLQQHSSMLTGSDADQKDYRKIKAAVDASAAAQTELDNLNAWVDAQIAKGKSWEQIQAAMQDDKFWNDYKTLQQMEQKRTGGGNSSAEKLDLGYGVDFTMPRWEAAVKARMEQPEADEEAPAIEATSYADYMATHSDEDRYELIESLQAYATGKASLEQIAKKYGTETAGLVKTWYPMLYHTTTTDYGGLRENTSWRSAGMDAGAVAGVIMSSEVDHLGRVKGEDGNYVDVMGDTVRGLMDSVSGAANNGYISTANDAEFRVQVGVAMEEAQAAGMTLDQYMKTQKGAHWQEYFDEVQGDLTSITEQHQKLEAAEQEQQRAYINDTMTASWEAVRNGTATAQQQAWVEQARDAWAAQRLQQDNASAFYSAEQKDLLLEGIQAMFNKAYPELEGVQGQYQYFNGTEMVQVGHDAVTENNIATAVAMMLDKELEKYHLCAAALGMSLDEYFAEYPDQAPDMDALRQQTLTRFMQSNAGFTAGVNDITNELELRLWGDQSANEASMNAGAEQIIETTQQEARDRQTVDMSKRLGGDVTVGEYTLAYDDDTQTAVRKTLTSKLRESGIDLGGAISLAASEESFDNLCTAIAATMYENDETDVDAAVDAFLADHSFNQRQLTHQSSFDRVLEQWAEEQAQAPGEAVKARRDEAMKAGELSEMEQLYGGRVDPLSMGFHQGNRQAGASFANALVQFLLPGNRTDPAELRARFQNDPVAYKQAVIDYLDDPNSALSDETRELLRWTVDTYEGNDIFELGLLAQGYQVEDWRDLMEYRSARLSEYVDKYGTASQVAAFNLMSEITNNTDLQLISTGLYLLGGAFGVSSSFFSTFMTYGLTEGGETARTMKEQYGMDDGLANMVGLIQGLATAKMESIEFERFLGPTGSAEGTAQLLSRGLNAVGLNTDPEKLVRYAGWLLSVPGNMVSEGLQEGAENIEGTFLNNFAGNFYETMLSGDKNAIENFFDSVAAGAISINRKDAWDAACGGALCSIFLSATGAITGHIINAPGAAIDEVKYRQYEKQLAEVKKTLEDPNVSREQLKKAAVEMATMMQDKEFLQLFNAAAAEAVDADAFAKDAFGGRFDEAFSGPEAEALRTAQDALQKAQQKYDTDSQALQQAQEALQTATQAITEASVVTDEMSAALVEARENLQTATDTAEASHEAMEAAEQAQAEARAAQDRKVADLFKQEAEELKKRREGMVTQTEDTGKKTKRATKEDAARAAEQRAYEAGMNGESIEALEAEGALTDAQRAAYENGVRAAQKQGAIRQASPTVLRTQVALAESDDAINSTPVTQAKKKVMGSRLQMSEFAEQMRQGKMTPARIRGNLQKYALLRDSLNAAEKEYAEAKQAELAKKYPAQDRLQQDIETMRTSEYGSREFNNAWADSALARREVAVATAEQAVEDARVALDESNPDTVEALVQAQSQLDAAKLSYTQASTDFARSAKKQMIEQLREDGQDRVADALESQSTDEVLNFVRTATREGKFDLFSAAEAAGIKWREVDPLTQDKINTLKTLATGKAGLTDTTGKYSWRDAWAKSTKGRGVESPAITKQKALLDAMGKKYGFEVVLVDDLDGRYNGTYLGGRTVYVAADAVEGALVQTGMHEAVHMLANQNREGYDLLVDAVREALGPDFNWNGRVMEQMEGTGMTQEEAIEEIIAEAVPTIMTSPSMLQSLSEENRSFLGKIYDALKNFFNDLKEIASRYADAQGRTEIDQLLKATEEQLGRIQEAFDLAAYTMDESQMPANQETGAKYSEIMEPVRQQHIAAQSEGDVNQEELERGNEAVHELFERAADTGVSDVFANGGVPLTRAQRAGVNGPIRGNIEYQYTFDVDTNCPKTIRFDNLVAVLSNMAGRNLTETEARNVINLMRFLGDDLPCSYCYMNNKRIIKSSFYNTFLERYADVMSLPADQQETRVLELWNKPNEQKGALRNLENWRGLSQQYTPADGLDILQSMRVDTETLRNLVNDVLDKAFPDERIFRDGLFYAPKRGQMIKAVADALGVPASTINGKAEKVFIDRLLNAWKSDKLGGRAHVMSLAPVDQAPVERIAQNLPAITGLYQLANNYSSSVSQAKSVQNYEPYSGQIWNVDVESKHNINSHDGFRIHSSNDFRVEYLPEYFQFFADLAADTRGGERWKAHAYSKQIAFAEIFWKTNAMINMSVAYNGDGSGITANTQEGVDPAVLRDFYRRHPEATNVGVMAMVTNDDQLGLAMADDGVHMIIPFHASGLEKRFYYNVQRWLDYTASQNESWINSNKEADAAIYKKDSKGNLTRVTPHFLPGDQVGFYDADGNAVTLPGHGNDVTRYKELCAEYGVHPRFYNIMVPEVVMHDDGSYEFTGKKIPATDHPGYLKLIKEGARSETGIEQKPVEANFDIDAALELARLGGTKSTAAGGQDQMIVSAATGEWSDGVSLLGEDRLLLTPEQEADMAAKGEDIDPAKYIRVEDLFNAENMNPKGEQSLAEYFRSIYAGQSQKGNAVQRASQIESAVDQQLADAIRRGDNYELMWNMAQQEYSDTDQIMAGLESEAKAYAGHKVRSGEWMSEAEQARLVDQGLAIRDEETGDLISTDTGEALYSTDTNAVRRTQPRTRLQRAMGVGTEQLSTRSNAIVGGAEQTAMSGQRGTRAVQRPARIAKTLARQLGVPLHRNLRQRGGGGIRGVYTPALRTIEARGTDTGDLKVTLHEIGHHLQERLGMQSTQQMMQEFGETNPEAFAEFVATYMFDRDTAVQHAGAQFVDEFESRMRNDGCYNDVLRAATEAREWAATDAYETIQADMTTHAEARKNAQRNRNRQWFRRMMTWLSASHAFKAVDALSADENGAQMWNGQRALGVQEAYQFSQHIPKQAKVILTDHLVDMYGNVIDERSFASIMRENHINEDNANRFAAYLYAQHALDRAAVDKAVWTDDIKSERAAREIVDTAPDNFKEAAKQYYDLMHKFRETWMVGTGLISQEQLENWEKDYPHYIPMFADLSDFAEDFGLGSQFGGTGFGSEWRFHEAHASNAPRFTFWESMPDLINSVVRRAARNSVAQTLYYQVLENGDALRDVAHISRIHQIVAGNVGTSMESPSNAPNAIEVMLPGGRRATVEVTDPLVLDVLQSDGSHGALSPLLSVMKKGVRVMSELTTSRNPVFAATNFMRDAQKAVTYGKVADANLIGEGGINTSATIVDQYLGAMYAGWQYARATSNGLLGRGYNNAALNLYGDLGGGGEIYVGSSSEKEAKDIRRALTGGNSIADTARGVLDVATLQRPAEISEQATRTLQFERSLRYYRARYGDTEYARVRAFLDSQQVTVDFAQGGYTEGYQRLRAIIPFMNPTMQGAYQNLEMIRDAFGGAGVTKEQARVARTRLVHTVIHYGLKAAAQMAVLRFFMDDDDREEYELTAEDIRRSNILLPAKLFGKGQERTFIRLPIGQGGVDALIYGGILKSMSLADEAMDLSFQNVILNAMGEMLPVDLTQGFTVDRQGRVNFDLVNGLTGMANSTIFGPLVSVAANRNYYGSEIEPSYMGSLPAQMRSYNSTPEAFNIMSQALKDYAGIDISPLRLQYLTEQWGGVVGQYVLPLMSKDSATGEWSPAYAWNKSWRVARNRFTIEPAYSNDIVQAYGNNYDSLKSITEAHKEGANRLPGIIPSADQDEVMALVEELQTQYKECNKEVTALNKQMKEIRGDSTIDYGTKQAMLRDLTMEQVKYEAAWNELYDAFMMQYGYGSLAWNLAMGR